MAKCIFYIFIAYGFMFSTEAQQKVEEIACCVFIIKPPRIYG